MTGLRTLQRFGAMPPGQRALLFRAVAIAGFVELGLRTLPLPTLGRCLGIRVVGRLPVERARAPAPAAAVADAVRAVDAIYRRRPRSGRCLRRALVLGALLGRYGPALRIGVAKVDTEFSAHAWVEISGVVMPDLPADVASEFVQLR